MEHRCILLYVEIVSVSVFTDLSQSSLFAMWDGNPIKDSLKGVKSFYNPPTGHLHDDAVLLLRTNPSGFYLLVKIRALLFKVLWDNQIYENERNSNDVIV